MEVVVEIADGGFEPMLENRVRQSPGTLCTRIIEIRKTCCH